MSRSQGLSHVAMSVPVGTLTDSFRRAVLDFYAEHFGWTEMEELRLPDRLTLSVGRGCYVNVREREDVTAYDPYDHVGLLLGSTEAVDEVYGALEREVGGVELEPLSRGDDGYRAFRFRHLLPLTIEVQFFPRA